MSPRLLVTTAIILFGGFLALWALQWKIGLGDFARSPQQVTVQLGTKTLVGGGRAGVEFDRRLGEQASLRVRCTGVFRTIALRSDETSDEICSVRIRLIGFSSATGTLATSRAHLEVTWDPGQAEAADSL